MGSTEAIRDLLEPVLASEGLELWDVEVSRRSVTVLVDRPGGIDLDSLATVANRVISPLLDEHPELTPPERFALEVSSPGVERTLRTDDQYRRYLGSEVSIKTTAPLAGSRRHRGVLLAVDPTGVRILPSEASHTTASGSPVAKTGRNTDGGADAGELQVPFELIERTRTVLVWGSPQAPQRRRRPAHKPSGRPAGSKAAAGAASGDTPSGNTPSGNTPLVSTPSDHDSKDLGS
jgi:ribosome maturation factor RimP